MSSLVANGAVIYLQLLFRESGDGRGSSFNGIIWVIAEIENSFSFQVEHGGGYSFYSDCGFHDGGQGLFMGENLTDGVRERAEFCFHWVCFGQGALGKRMW